MFHMLKSGHYATMISDIRPILEEARDKSDAEEWDRIHKKIFHLAEQEPICQGQIRGDFGYLSNTPTTIQVLSGTYNYPLGCNVATKDLLQECELIRHIVPKYTVSSTFQTKSWGEKVGEVYLGTM